MDKKQSPAVHSAPNVIPISMYLGSFPSNFWRVATHATNNIERKNMVIEHPGHPLDAPLLVWSLCQEGRRYLIERQLEK